LARRGKLARAKLGGSLSSDSEVRNTQADVLHYFKGDVQNPLGLICYFQG